MWGSGPLGCVLEVGGESTDVLPKSALKISGRAEMILIVLCQKMARLSTGVVCNQVEL